MGVDYILQKAKKFKKAWDIGRIELKTRDLFMCEPHLKTRRFAASVEPGAQVALGELLTVRVESEGMFAMRGLRKVATFQNPPPLTLEQVQSHNGIAQGSVEEIHQFSGMIDISICARPPR